MADSTVPARQVPAPSGSNGSVQPATYCGECGGPRTSGAFCQHCGAPNRLPEPQTLEIPSEVPAGAKPPTNRRFSRRLVTAAAVVVIILLVGATLGVVHLLGNKSKGPSYATQAGQTLAPVLSQNAALAADVTSLTPGASSQTVRGAITTSQAAVRAAQQSFVGLAAPRSQTGLAAQINLALTSEMAWLQTASAILKTDSSPLLSQLSGLGVDAQTRVETLSPSIPAAGTAAFPSSTQIVTYTSAALAKTAAAAQATAAASAAKARQAAAAKAATAEATAADTQFSNQVLSLLDQSTASRQAISTFYQQLETVVNGGTASFTLAQAEQQITTIVANRTSLASAAQALNAPDPATQAVSAQLAAAFNASLADDTDLDNCLNQQNDGTEAFIFQSCLSASTADSATATADKQTFLNTYNQLRATIGQPAIDLEF